MHLLFPQNILLIALIVGVIHINMGLFIGAYNNITRGEVREALGAQIVWFILEIGVIIAAVAYLTIWNHQCSNLRRSYNCFEPY